MLLAVQDVARKFTLQQLSEGTFADMDIQSMYDQVHDKKHKNTNSHYFISVGVCKLLASDFEDDTSEGATFPVETQIQNFNSQLPMYTLFHSFTKWIWELSPKFTLNLHILCPIRHGWNTTKVRNIVHTRLVSCGFETQNNAGVIKVELKTPDDICNLHKTRYMEKPEDQYPDDHESNDLLRKAYNLDDVYYSPDFITTPQI